ncbi:MAG TPA: ABC transporter ATP-binding protein [Nitrospiria bacterium]|nr:ABC transporter ATP-binding protein [Nitrospiria bacterium]
MIVCDQLSKQFVVGLRQRKVTALQGLDLKIEAGEIFGFLGPNGAGKTTTLKILMGLIHPTSGRASLLGKPLGDVGVKQQIGFLPESPYFYDYLTADEFLLFYGQLFGMPRAELKCRIDELLTLVGLANSRSLRLRRFSKGMLQRVGLAQALINDPKLVMLDEPMSGLDPIGRKEVRDLILHLKEQGKTVFFSSHILSDVETICNRVGILINGRLREVGSVEELLGRYGVKTVEIIMEGIDGPPAERLRAMAVKSVVTGPRIWLLFDSEARVDEAVALIVKDGGRLISLTRQKGSLEDLFVKEVALSGGAVRS